MFIIKSLNVKVLKMKKKVHWFLFFDFNTNATQFTEIYQIKLEILYRN